MRESALVVDDSTYEETKTVNILTMAQKQAIVAPYVNAKDRDQRREALFAIARDVGVTTARVRRMAVEARGPIELPATNKNYERNVEILQLLASGESVNKVAEAFPISRSAVYDVKVRYKLPAVLRTEQTN